MRIDMSKPDPIPWVAPDGCRFQIADAQDSNVEHCGLVYAPRWRVA